LRKASLSASYSHGVTGGSGVLAGSVTNSTSGSVSQRLTQALTGTFTVGYSRNQGVVIPGLNGTAGTGYCIPLQTGNCLSSNQTYDYVFGGAGLSRSLGRSATIYGHYQVNYQNSSASFCLTVTCGRSYIQHQISLSLGWRPQPFAF